jgi:predicted SnoaL-like aldol condensation-catalyzing enzyme
MRPLGILVIGYSILAWALPLGLAAKDLKKEELNRKVVLEFYELAINRKKAEALDRYFGNRYTQHNPMAADGPGGLKGFIGYMKEKMPRARAKIKKVFTDGDYVILHVHFIPEPGSRGQAVVDIFKLEDGKVVEHWDVIQDIPEKAANKNGMF